MVNDDPEKVKIHSQHWVVLELRQVLAGKISVFAYFFKIF